MTAYTTYWGPRRIISQRFDLTLYHTIPTFSKKPLENIVGKGENPGNQHFLLFPQFFLLFSRRISLFWTRNICGLRWLWIWTSPKWRRLVKELTSKQHALYRFKIRLHILSSLILIYAIHKSPWSLPCHQMVNPFPLNETFWRPWETSLLKTLWENEKWLITSNFFFSHSVFYPFG